MWCEKVLVDNINCVEFVENVLGVLGVYFHTNNGKLRYRCYEL